MRRGLSSQFFEHLFVISIFFLFYFLHVHLRQSKYAAVGGAVAVRLTERRRAGAQRSVDEQLDAVARQHLAVGGAGRRETSVVARSRPVVGRVEDAQRKATLTGELAERRPRSVLTRLDTGHSVT